MSPRDLLAKELERRGRSWGSVNADRITAMHEEVALLHHRPRLRAVIMARHFGAKTSLGWGDGAYMQTRGSVDYARSRQRT